MQALQTKSNIEKCSIFKKKKMEKSISARELYKALEVKSVLALGQKLT